MRFPQIEMRYFETYYFANVVQGVLEDAGGYIRSLHDWGGDEATTRFLTAYPKWSHLHSLIAFIVSSVIDETIGKANLAPLYDGKYASLWIDDAMRCHNITGHSFSIYLKEAGVTRSEATEDDVYDYHQWLAEGGELDKLIQRISDEVFQLVFGNRALLLHFNNLARAFVAEIEADGDPRVARDGILKRVRPPAWAKRAVFYRDRGRCTACNCDLSGLLSLQNDNNFDHIVPLAYSGLNDVSNLQLLCATCNNHKGASPLPVSISYERWYDVSPDDLP